MEIVWRGGDLIASEDVIYLTPADRFTVLDLAKLLASELNKESADHYG
jgi:hypothetical protein